MRPRKFEYHCRCEGGARSSSTGGNLLRHHLSLSSPLLHGSVWCFSARPYRDTQCFFLFCTVAALLRFFSGRQVFQHLTEGTEEEEPAGLFPRVSVANAREDGGQCRPARVQVRVCVSRQGGGAGKRMTRGRTACSCVYLSEYLARGSVLCFVCLCSLLACMVGSRLWLGFVAVSDYFYDVSKRISSVLVLVLVVW